MTKLQRYFEGVKAMLYLTGIFSMFVLFVWLLCLLLHAIGISFNRDTLICVLIFLVLIFGVPLLSMHKESRGEE